MEVISERCVCMYDAIVRSTLFGVRNADKVINTNDKGRIFADVGQFANAAKYASKLDNQLGKGAQAAINALGSVAKESKVLSAVSKGVNLAANNVNPLLVGAAGYRVLIAEDKATAVKRETLGMGCMFATESLMREFFNSTKASNFKNNIKNKYARTTISILEGILFVCGSIAGSTFGYKVGDACFKKNKNTASASKEISVPNQEAQKAKEADKYEQEFYIAGENKELLG